MLQLELLIKIRKTNRKMLSTYLSSYFLSETGLKPNISLSGERDIPEMRSTAPEPDCIRQREPAALPKPVRVAGRA